MISMKLSKLKLTVDEDRLKAALVHGSIDPLVKCCLLLESDAKRSMRIGGGKAHLPSLPTEVPHVQTGALRSSIGYALLDATSAIVGPTERYGKWLEYGTRMMAARPFMRPALLRVRTKFAKQFTKLSLRKIPS